MRRELRPVFVPDGCEKRRLPVVAYVVHDLEKHTEVEIDNDFVGYILNTYVSDKTIEEVGKDKVEAVISDLIEYGAIDTDEIEKDSDYIDYMEERHSDNIQDEIEKKEENARAWAETYASLPR